MEGLFKVLAANIAEHVTHEVKRGLAPVAPYLRMLSLGVVLVVLSSALWAIGALFLLIALYFSLAPISGFTVPALWSALISWVLAAIFVGIGLGMLRKPR